MVIRLAKIILLPNVLQPSIDEISHAANQVRKNVRQS